MGSWAPGFNHQHFKGFLRIFLKRIKEEVKNQGKSSFSIRIVLDITLQT